MDEAQAGDVTAEDLDQIYGAAYDCLELVNHWVNFLRILDSLSPESAVIGLQKWQDFAAVTVAGFDHAASFPVQEAITQTTHSLEFSSSYHWGASQFARSVLGCLLHFEGFLKKRSRGLFHQQVETFASEGLGQYLPLLTHHSLLVANLNSEYLKVYRAVVNKAPIQVSKIADIQGAATGEDHAAKHLDNLAELEKSTPKLTFGDGAWVPVTTAKDLEGLESETLSKYRSQGLRNSHLTLGRDIDGRVWRKANKNGHTYYLRTTLHRKD